jgi:hypothetical protein
MDIRYGRKRSGIRRELENKIEGWLDTIDDVDVQSLARNNTIVTGGSIASMLLGEKVNDFDIYFRDKETTLAVARYYVDKFNKANELKSIPEVREESLENIKGEVEDRVVIWIQSAGVASEEQDEYHYFETRPEKETEEFALSLNTIKEGEPYRPIFMSQNAITLSNKIQLVIRFYGEPDKIHDNYDYVHATCYWDHGKKILHLNPEAMESLLARNLIYRGSLYPIASIFRMKKFIERDWRISAGEQLKIMWQISEIDLSDPDTMREQLTGVDMAYMWQLIQALDKVDKDKINSAYVASIIDRIFNGEIDETDIEDSIS